MTVKSSLILFMSNTNIALVTLIGIPGCFQAVFNVCQMLLIQIQGKPMYILNFQSVLRHISAFVFFAHITTILEVNRC